MVTSVSKMSSKGQVVIPLDIRKRLGIEEGDNIKFIIDENGETKIEVVKKKAILDLFGVAKPKLDTSDFKKVLKDSLEERMESKSGDNFQ
ncbi:AbrB/MazE/SpoVT family DNA-binding domain-containing protein [Aneurinibacillus terranovensis]|uniref:AbrB/MazE/SpoVT family DNA-binding domain-containing protein n=1 Tax=Aneurinibacillus terranovensis TaxID=278991 RepID=UPI00055020DA|nr:AbrB/MazE/SpoVT family DNA-binding domain-containing protein [Aneurinibacillus terranovensis]